MDKTKETDDKDRRRFFRIDDEVNLFYKIVDEQAVITASQLTDDLLSNCSLVTALDMLDQESNLIMYRIEKNEPEIAEDLLIALNEMSAQQKEALAISIIEDEVINYVKKHV